MRKLEAKIYNQLEIIAGEIHNICCHYESLSKEEIITHARAALDLTDELQEFIKPFANNNED